MDQAGWKILGVRVDAVTMDEALARGLELLERPGTHRVITPNPELLSQAARRPELCALLNRAELSLADGVGVLLAARLRGARLPDRVPGVDYAAALARRAGERGKRIYLLGARSGVAQEAGRRLLRDCPGLVLAGAADGYFADPARAADEIARARADLVFVCLGAPRQEEWMDRYGARTGARLLLGLGGTLDVLSGRVGRAPALWQRWGLEWLWRALRQPSRLGRLYRLPLFLAQVWMEEGRGICREN